MTTTDRALRWLAYGLAAVLALSVVDALVCLAYYDAWSWDDAWLWGWNGAGLGLAAASLLAVVPLTVALAVVAALLVDRTRQQDSGK